MNALIVFVKAPAPGQVKTRLCPPLTPGQAAALYLAFVQDTVATADKVSGARVEIAYDACGAAADLGWLGPSAPSRFFLQQGADLGRRLQHAFAKTFAGGARKAVVIGSDIPDLEPAIVESAFGLLDVKDAVLGPAEDGGYYLVGLKRPNPSLFAGIHWSTSTVFSETLARVEAGGLTLGLLARRADVDAAADLEGLARRLSTATASTCPATRLALKGLEVKR